MKYYFVHNIRKYISLFVEVAMVSVVNGWP